MKKVRIYDLKKEIGLDSCTPIVSACQRMGIKVNSASSTITKSQARQVAEVLAGDRPQPSPLKTKASKPQQSRAMPLKKSATKKRTAKPSSSMPASASSKAMQKSSKTTGLTTTAEGSSIEPAKTGQPYLNGNRVFTLKISGLAGARPRQAIATYSVPFNRLGSEIQRINRSEAKIVGISCNM